MAPREEAVEIFVVHDIAQLFRGLPAQVMGQEIMRLLGRREAHLGVLPQIFGHRGRSATRRADDERPARGFGQSRCQFPLFQLVHLAAQTFHGPKEPLRPVDSIANDSPARRYRGYLPAVQLASEISAKLSLPSALSLRGTKRRLAVAS